MTNREFFNTIVNGTATIKEADGFRTINLVVNGAINPEIVEFAQTSINKLDEKNEKRKNSPAKQKKSAENEELINQIYDFMTEGRTYTSSEIATALDKTTSKISAMFKVMVSEDRVTVVDGYKPEKGKSKVKGYIKNV